MEHALSNLWERFNKYHDYPVIIWHTGVKWEEEIEYRNSGGVKLLMKRKLGKAKTAR